MDDWCATRQTHHAAPTQALKSARGGREHHRKARMRNRAIDLHRTEILCFCCGPRVHVRHARPEHGDPCFGCFPHPCGRPTCPLEQSPAGAGPASSGKTAGNVKLGSCAKPYHFRFDPTSEGKLRTALSNQTIRLSQPALGRSPSHLWQRGSLHALLATWPGIRRPVQWTLRAPGCTRG